MLGNTNMIRNNEGGLLSLPDDTAIILYWYSSLV